MLFVNDHHTKAFKNYSVLNECVRADNDVDSTTRQVAQYLFAFFSRDTTSQQLNPQWSVTKKILRIGNLQISNKLLDSNKVLLGQHFCWRHDCTLMSSLYGSEHCSNSNNSFSTTNITLQQSMHWVWSCKIGSDLVDHPSLCTSEPKGQSRDKSIHQFVIDHVSNSG